MSFCPSPSGTKLYIALNLQYFSFVLFYYIFILLQVTGLVPGLARRREAVFRVSVLVLTFLAYTSYHLSRKPISIVKNSDAFLHCGANHTTNTSCT